MYSAPFLTRNNRLTTKNRDDLNDKTKVLDELQKELMLLHIKADFRFTPNIIALYKILTNSNVLGIWDKLKRCICRKEKGVQGIPQKGEEYLLVSKEIHSEIDSINGILDIPVFNNEQEKEAKEMLKKDNLYYKAKEATYNIIKPKDNNETETGNVEKNKFWENIWSAPPALLLGLILGVVFIDKLQPACFKMWFSLGIISVLFLIGTLPRLFAIEKKIYKWSFLVLGVIFPILLLVAHIICFNILKITI